MTVIGIADFSGMLPLREPILLPDNYAQFSSNTWLYKGAVRGIRVSDPIYTLKRPLTTQQIYRIPLDNIQFNWSNSLFLEFPDPYILGHLSPVVGDQYDRYYFFPSSSFVADSGGWFNAPFYAPKANFQAGGPYYLLGIPTPGVAPGVTGAPSSLTLTVTADTPAGDTVINFASTTGVSVGENVSDLTNTNFTLAATANTPVGDTVLDFASTTGVTNGMGVADTTNTLITLTANATTTPGNLVLNFPSTAGLSFNGMTVVDNTTTNVTTTTTSFITAGGEFFTVASLAGITVGMSIMDTTTPGAIAAGTTVVAINTGSSEIQMSAGAVTNGGPSDTVVFTSTNAIPGGTKTVWVSATQVALSNPVRSGGVLSGDQIIFSSNNAVASGTTVVGHNSTQVVLSEGVVNGGIITGDQIKFTNNNQIPGGAVVNVVTPTQVEISIPAANGGVVTGDQIQFSSITEVRSYLYTYISAYGEEGAPSPANNASGNPNGTWTITVDCPTSGQMANRNLTTIRLYRSVTDSSGNSTFFQVAGIAITTPGATITYNDSFFDTDIINNLILPAVVYTPPPAGLQGVVAMANGIWAGWTNNREVWFSAAFLPHAWPASYALTVDYDIIGLNAIGSSLSILTSGQPFIATGTTPDTMTIGKITANEPCISRGSIFAAAEGTYYASPNGLILLNTSGTINVSQFSIEREFWNSQNPTQWAAGRVGLSYVAFIKGATAASSSGGIILDHLEKNVPCSVLQPLIEAGEKMVNLFWDEWSGQLLMVHNKYVRWFMPFSGGILYPWVYKSKKFRLPKPAQFGAFKINFDVPPEITIPAPTPQSRNTSQTQMFDPTKQYLIIRVYADGAQILVQEIVQDNEVLSIPGGLKKTYWEFQFEGQINMYLFKVASSVKELIKA